MTFKEKWKQEHKGELFYYTGWNMCPYSFGYEPLKNKPCIKGMTCGECWNRQIENGSGDMQSEFTKNDLKTGHIVTLRNGKEFSVVLDMVFQSGHKNILLNSYINQCESLDAYNFDMTLNNQTDFDIVKVRKPTLYCCIGYPHNDVGGKVIYKREEVKEMTVTDIEKELGHPVKIVKE